MSTFIDESDFGVQIFKDVATVRDLSSEGTPVNLDKFHYTVTERSIEDIITANSQCSTVGFGHDEFVEKITDDNLMFYAICVNYVGECEGTIYPDEVKTCTVENYIFAEIYYPLPTDDNTAGAAQYIIIIQQSNNHHDALSTQYFKRYNLSSNRNNKHKILFFLKYTNYYY